MQHVANERQSKLMGNVIKRLRNKAGRYRSEVYPNPGQSGFLPISPHSVLYARHDIRVAFVFDRLWACCRITNSVTALQYHYAQLQALAFEEDFDLSQRIDEIDKTYPKYHGMHKAAGDFMAEWNKAIEEDERAVEGVKKGATKRAAPVMDVSRPFWRNLLVVPLSCLLVAPEN